MFITTHTHHTCTRTACRVRPNVNVWNLSCPFYKSKFFTKLDATSFACFPQFPQFIFILMFFLYRLLLYIHWNFMSFPPLYVTFEIKSLKILTIPKTIRKSNFYSLSLSLSPSIALRGTQILFTFKTAFSYEEQGGCGSVVGIHGNKSGQACALRREMHFHPKILQLFGLPFLLCSYLFRSGRLVLEDEVVGDNRNLGT